VFELTCQHGVAILRPNHAMQRTARQRRWRVPSALRASAAADRKRSAAARGLNVCQGLRHEKSSE
jgi:hypothetical protein